MRVLSVNDISCIGKCSLSVTLPIVSACGVTCDFLPTALLSTHTGGFEGYTFRDLTDELDGIIAHWKTLGIQYDVIYSGYLGSIQQIDTVLALKREFLKEGGILVVDPVMGDSGKLYAGFTDAFVAHMRKLCSEADYILPNLTEACLLANVPYPKCGETANGEFLVNKLLSLRTCPIVTGVEEDGEIAVYYQNGQSVKRYATPTTAGFFCGAGDVFASAFVGALANEKPLQDAVAISADFTTACIERSKIEVPDKRYGLNFEKEIPSLLKKLFGTF